VVDVERIKSDIEELKNLSAEEYCKEEVARVYADFEASREKKIAELETSLQIFEKYQIVENPESEDENEEEGV